MQIIQFLLRFIKAYIEGVFAGLKWFYGERLLRVGTTLALTAGTPLLLGIYVFHHQADWEKASYALCIFFIVLIASCLASPVLIFKKWDEAQPKFEKEIEELKSSHQQELKELKSKILKLETPAPVYLKNSLKEFISICEKLEETEDLTFEVVVRLHEDISQIIFHGWGKDYRNSFAAQSSYTEPRKDLSDQSITVSRMRSWVTSHMKNPPKVESDFQPGSIVEYEEDMHKLVE